MKRNRIKKAIVLGVVGAALPQLGLSCGDWATLVTGYTGVIDPVSTECYDYYDPYYDVWYTDCYDVY